VKGRVFLILSIFFTANVIAQVPLDTIITLYDDVQTLRISGVDDDFIFYLVDDKEKKVPRSSVKEVRYAFDSSLDVDDTKKEVIFEEVIPCPNYSKEQLYLGARRWLISHFKDSKEVVQFDDKEDAIVIAQGWADITGVWNALNGIKERLWFTMKIQAKDGRFKVTIDDMYTTTKTAQFGESKSTLPHLFWKKNGDRKKAFKGLRQRIENVISQSIISLANSFEEEPESDDDW